MHKFRHKTESSQHLGISFEFYTTEKSEYRKPETSNRHPGESGFRSIPFQSKYPLQLNYMQRPKKDSIFRTLFSWNF